MRLQAIAGEHDHAACSRQPGREFSVRSGDGKARTLGTTLRFSAGAQQPPERQRQLARQCGEAAGQFKVVRLVDRINDDDLRAAQRSLTNTVIDERLIMPRIPPYQHNRIGLRQIRETKTQSWARRIEFRMREIELAQAMINVIRTEPTQQPLQQ